MPHKHTVNQSEIEGLYRRFRQLDKGRKVGGDGGGVLCVSISMHRATACWGRGVVCLGARTARDHDTDLHISLNCTYH